MRSWRCAGNNSIVIVISHRPSVLAALNMAMVLYEGKTIAFGSREQIFARVHTAPGQSAAAVQAVVTPGAKKTQRAAVAERV